VSPTTGDAPRLVRSLSVFDATTLIVGSVIGSGIFVAPSLMAGYVLTPGLLLGLWLVGGLLTLCGALAVAELAAAMPTAGGQYVYLTRAFGSAAGFLYGWTFLLAINTGFVAAVSVAFAKYLGVLLPGIDEQTPLVELWGARLSTAQGVALLVIVLLSALNAIGVRAGALVQNAFTVAKVAAIAALLALALVLGRGSAANFTPLLGLELGPEGVKLGLFAALAVAMSKALFAYDAWYSVTFTAEEVRDPGHNLPRALVYGTLGITGVYMAAVAAYLYMVPIGEMAAVPDNRIAAEAARRLLGGAGEAAIALAILASTFGCVNGLILTGARVVFAMARDGLFFGWAGELHAVRRTPTPALWLQAAIAAGLTLTGTYSDLLTMVAFVSLLFNTLTVAAVFMLRAREPELPRPYRSWGYPLLPAVFILTSLFFLVFILKGDPRNSGLGLLLAALGLPAYAFFRRRQSR
jgi:APA family basic amino acid/polyamine antiporter